MLQILPDKGALTIGEFQMKNFALKVQRFLASEDGPTAVEYAVMLALIVVVCLGAITTIGTNAKATFNEVANVI
jgi:pilus assembly protein Flp/PilA